MSRATSPSQATAWARRTAPAAERVRDGLAAIAMPAPDSPIAYTLVYLFEADEGVALVDTGWRGEASQEALRRELAALGWTVDDIRLILITHMHPDHLGLAPWLLERVPDCTVVMHDHDLRLVDERSDEHRARTAVGWQEQMRSIGAPAHYDILTRLPIQNRILPTHRDRVRSVEDGEVIEFGGWRLRALWTPGHSPGHLCFEILGTDCVITGDHVLPTISPQVSQLSEPGTDTLGLYLDSLRRIRTLSADHVLPAHQYRFRGLAARVDELLEHHAFRLDVLREQIAKQPGSTCFDLVQFLDWRSPLAELPLVQARMAIKETLAHLTHLERIGELQVTADTPGQWFPRTDHSRACTLTERMTHEEM